MKSLLDSYTTIYLACHRQHLRTDEDGDAVTDRQVSVLNHLDTTHGKTLSKLAEHMGVSRSTMSITVDRLVRRGYIRQQKDKADARCTSLTLTPGGMRLREQNTVLDPVLLDKMFRLAPPPELEASLQGIETLAKYAGILLRQRKRERDA